MKEEKIKIPEGISKLILAEGADDKHFLIELLNALKIKSIHVFDFECITKLTNFIKSIGSFNDNYADVTAILIARDSEKSSVSAAQSINTSLRKIGLSDTDLKPFQLEQKIKKVGFVLFPGYDEHGKLCEKGTLEDLCLKIFKQQEIIIEVDKYLEDFQNNRVEETIFPRKHKNRLHATFSFTDKYVGKTIGQTTIMGGFDFASLYLKPFIDVITVL
jgi:hypothetical protein